MMNRDLRNFNIELYDQSIADRNDGGLERHRLHLCKSVAKESRSCFLYPVRDEIKFARYYLTALSVIVSGSKKR